MEEEEKEQAVVVAIASCVNLYLNILYAPKYLGLCQTLFMLSGSEKQPVFHGGPVITQNRQGQIGSNAKNKRAPNMCTMLLDNKRLF